MKLFDWLRPKLRVPEGQDDPQPRSRDELVLAARLARATDGGLFGGEAWAAVEHQLAAGREAEVIDVLRRFIAAQPRDLDVALRLSELLCGRLEHAAARPLLERLAGSPPHRLRALLLLGEGAERAGDLEAARAAYERVLAIDLDHVRARAGADRLRPASAPPAPAAPTVPEGTTPVAAPGGGRYRLRTELGRGSSATVYLADDVEVGREAALKLLHPRARAGGGAHASRAWEEARIAAALRHPGVIAIYDLDEDRQLIAMELCRGGALRAHLDRGPLPPEQALAALAQLLATLAAAHAHGVVHGDVKPANLLLRRVPEAALLDEDALVLCDFGLAHLDSTDPDRVAGRAARGTLAYMAPEQRRGVLGPAVDLYAAGVVAVELFAGAAGLRPLLADRAALLRGDASLGEGGALPASARDALGVRAEPAEAIVTSLLARDPAARPSAETAAAAVRALADRPVV